MTFAKSLSLEQLLIAFLTSLVFAFLSCQTSSSSGSGTPFYVDN